MHGDACTLCKQPALQQTLSTVITPSQALDAALLDLQAVPYWVDDESVRASMAASGPSPPRSIEGCAPGTWKLEWGVTRPSVQYENSLRPLLLLCPVEAFT